MPIPFTEYVLPYGARRSLEVKRSEGIETKAQAILAKGFHFECEQLRNGMWSYTIGDEDGDYAHELSVNGPADTMAIDTMVTEFHDAGMPTPKEEA